ncbi:MAG: AraC family ligand binding domain-containing protein, partial [Lachnospiraceae bacterium]|nr:AraC family ligand binding domain-containing protein [Lachnospiraceae bacterium]
HTHIGHLVFGIVTEGKVGVKIDQDEFICNEGEMFSIALNMKHSIYPIFFDFVWMILSNYFSQYIKTVMLSDRNWRVFLV